MNSTQREMWFQLASYYAWGRQDGDPNLRVKDTVASWDFAAVYVAYKDAFEDDATPVTSMPTMQYVYDTYLEHRSVTIDTLSGRFEIVKNPEALRSVNSARLVPVPNVLV